METNVKLDDLNEDSEETVQETISDSQSTFSRIRSHPDTALVIVTFAFFVDYVVFLACVPILPLYGQKLQLTDVEIGLLFSSRAIATIASNPVMGLISDKFGRRIPMLGGLFVLTLATFLFAFAETYSLLLIARIVQGIASSANVTGGMALIADCYPAPVRKQKLSKALMGISVGVLTGAPVGGLLYQLGGMKLPFLIFACLIAIDGIARWLFLVEPKKAVSEEKDQTKMTFKEQIALYGGILKDVQIMLLVLGLFTGNAMIAMMEVTLPLLLEQEFHFKAWQIGLIYGANTFSYSISMYCLGKFFTWKRWVGLALGVGVMGACNLVILIIDSPIWVIPFWVVIGFGMACVDYNANTQLADLADKRHPGSYGKVYGVSETGVGIGFITGPIIGSALLSPVHFRGTWMIFGGILVITSIFILIGFAKNTGNTSFNALRESEQIELNEPMESVLVENKNP